MLPPPDGATPHLGLYADTQVSDFYHCVEVTPSRRGDGAGDARSAAVDTRDLAEHELREIGEAFIAAAWRA